MFMFMWFKKPEYEMIFSFLCLNVVLYVFDNNL